MASVLVLFCFLGWTFNLFLTVNKLEHNYLLAIRAINIFSVSGFLFIFFKTAFDEQMFLILTERYYQSFLLWFV